MQPPFTCFATAALAAAISSFTAPPASAACLASPIQAGISNSVPPAPHVGPLPVRSGVARSGGCGGDGCTVVDFEGIGNLGVIGTVTGPVDVTFGPSWLALVDSDAGGSGNFANEPTPDTVAFVNAGTPEPIDFSTGVNFIEIFYVAGTSSIPMTLTAWDGPSGTGNVVDTSMGDVVGNGTNCTGDPNGAFCLWDVVTLTSTGNNIRSITLSGAMADQFAFDSMTFCTSGDIDGDGLLDQWESCGLDINGDGTIDLDLPAMGADPTVPDVFVEIDAMANRNPSAATLALVEAAFAAEGVTLHAMLDETALPGAPWASSWDGFDAFKASFFGTAAERASANAANILAARRQAFHYCVFAEQHGGGSSPGLAEMRGNDFFVTLAATGWTLSGSEAERAGMFMHLLGHNLGLGDGGADQVGYKPNYKSIMNPMWMLPRSHNAGRFELDYSTGPWSMLDEAALDETQPLGGAFNDISFAGPPPFSVIVASDQIDWDRSGGIGGGLLDLDVNRVDASLPASPMEQYSDHDDWGSLVLNFRDSADFADGVHTDVAPDNFDATLNSALDAVSPVPTSYCPGEPSSLGLVATVSGSGTATLAGPDDFEVVATGVLGQTFGVLVTSISESRGAFVGGTLCVEQPFVRTALVASGGTVGESDGELRGAVSQAFMAGQGWTPGTVVYAQWINRDFGLASQVGSTPALVFVVTP